ncbi:hypothetical protein CFC21_107737 [Triticum aestivum]|uniref:Sulfiredoxin n=3 Tax=Triticum aestivum TaxID=4565 RepID=A0A9R1MGM0_WHEAT|nr:sulfiredoxin, chloroplastic/mitochondrial-like [Triticum aestivum]KAF7107055.1 hypothetical protein CFC21_107737 [Triticum aestivum]
MASTSSLDLGKIVPPAGFLHCRAAVLSAPVLWGRSASGRCSLAVSVSSSNGAAGLSPLSDSEKKGPVVMEIPLEDIRRPLMRTRANDSDKVQELMDSIRVISLQVPVGFLSFNINFSKIIIFSS